MRYIKCLCAFFVVFIFSFAIVKGQTITDLDKCVMLKLNLTQDQYFNQPNDPNVLGNAKGQCSQQQPNQQPNINQVLPDLRAI